jgi:glycosyltransferase involved in cell wall biosynthesis
VTGSDTKRVLFIAYYFPPRGGAGVQRSLKFVKYLRSFGWEPTIVTAEYASRDGAYDGSLLSEVPEGTRIVALPSDERRFAALSKRGLGRIAGFVIRPDTAIIWANRALPVACKLHAERPFDAIYTSVQPWSAGLLGMWLKEDLALPWVSDFRDPWTRSFHLLWPTRLHWKLDFRFERRLVERADRTLVVTHTMRDYLLMDHQRVDPEKVSILLNGFDEEDAAGETIEDDGKFTIVFTGKFQYDYHSNGVKRTVTSRIRKLGTYGRRDVMLDTHSPIYFLQALRLFLDRFPERRALMRVLFAGTTGDGNKALIGKLGLDDVVECLGYVSHARSVSLTKSADALLLPMFSTGDPLERCPYASGKIYEYMAARRPILALTQEGDAKDLALGSGLGLAAPPRDVSAIAAAIEGLFDAWRSGSSRFAPREEFINAFSRRRLAARLATILDEVSGGRRR